MKPKEELIKASDHLHYEIWMLRLTAFLLSGVQTGSTSLEASEGEAGVPIHAYTHTTHLEVSVYSSNAPYTPPSPTEHEAVQGNAILESFAIHLRSLLDFFYIDASRAKPGDVLAEHYFPQPAEWHNAKPQLAPDEIARMKERVNKEIAHLTYERNRIAGIDWEWPIIQFKTHVIEALTVFLRRVDRSLLSVRWEERSA
jgi:hypothetical protein